MNLNKLFISAAVAFAAWGAIQMTGTPTGLPQPDFSSHKNIRGDNISPVAKILGLPDATEGEIRQGNQDFRVDIHAKNSFAFIQRTPKAVQFTKIDGDKARTTIVWTDGHTEQYEEGFSHVSGLDGQKQRTLFMALPSPVRSKILETKMFKATALLAELSRK